MGLPLHLSIKLGTHLMKMKLRGVAKFPMIVEVEPLFACNLKCVGCGKIQHPASELKRRMPVEQAVAAVEECGAPMVSLAGGEPLMHTHLHKFTPSKNFAWMVHIDGLRDRHDESVSKEGVFDQAVAAIKQAKAAGFQVYTNSTFFNTDSPQTVIDELKVDRMEISPGYAYEKAPAQDRFLGVEQTRELFSDAFAGGRRKKWRLNHSPLFLDFLEGKRDFACTPWGVPSYSLLGWQRPCYLLADGYAKTYAELLETTEWEKFGRGKDPRCDNCMAHCGYEPSAVLATMSSLRESIRATVSV